MSIEELLQDVDPSVAQRLAKMPGIAQEDVTAACVIEWTFDAKETLKALVLTTTQLIEVGLVMTFRNQEWTIVRHPLRRFDEIALGQIGIDERAQTTSVDCTLRGRSEPLTLGEPKSTDVSGAYNSGSYRQAFHRFVGELVRSV